MVSKSTLVFKFDDGHIAGIIIGALPLHKTIELSKIFAGHPDLSIKSWIPLASSPVQNSWWVKLASRDGSVEGKLFLPRDKAQRLIIFEPGFPGSGSTDLERLHLPALIDEGFALFTARHNGTILNGKHSDYYVNCAERQQQAKEQNEHCLGRSAGSSIEEWLNEPLIAFTSLSQPFEEIILMGHSFGGVAIVYSAIAVFKNQLPNRQKLKRLVSLAGDTARVRSSDDPLLQKWAGEHGLGGSILNEKLQLCGTQKNLQTIHDSWNELHKNAKSIRDSVDLICVAPWGDAEDGLDELCPPQEALDLIVSLGRGTLVIDKTEKADSKKGQMAHDMGNLKTDMILRFLDLSWRPEKQILCLDSSGLH